MKIKYIDLFAGVGGFHYGLQKVNEMELRRCGQEENKMETTMPNIISKSNKRQLPYSCVYSNEYDKYANSIYRKNYGECDIRDIKTVKASEIPDHDLLCGGFPCQSFSIAGKRRGFEDTRGTLFFEIARILKQKQPRLLLLENVKGLLSHDKGKTFTTIISTLDELGYDCQWQVLNSKNFGIPQNRERVFIVGHFRGTPRPKVFPITGAISKNIKVNSILNSDTWKKRNESIRRVHSIEGISPTIPTGTGGGVMTKIINNTSIRRLTPTECERLQGFPDNWTKIGAEGEQISDTQRYKMCGNAVTTNVITEIGKRLLVY